MSSVTMTDGRDWWLMREGRSGRQRYPERIRVGPLKAPKAYVPERKARPVYRPCEAFPDWQKRSCGACGRMLGGAWRFCPYCGCEADEGGEGGAQ